MNRFIRFFNQNRIGVIVTILIVVFVILIIQVVNYFLKQNQGNNQTENYVIQDTSIPSESVITGEEIPDETTEENVDIINQFVEFCNNQQYENAYNLLTQDCKDELYSSLDSFIENYCNTVFTANMTYTAELWYNTTNMYTYRITYFENNILATGDINTGDSIEDYITVLSDDGEIKLNINDFINKEDINKSQTAENVDITITVNERYQHRDYEKYTVTIVNNTDKTILISDGIDSNDICLIDTNDVEYNSKINEIPGVILEFSPGTQRTIEISFYKMYNLYRTIDSMSFKSIILDKEAYEQNSESAETTSINIEI